MAAGEVVLGGLHGEGIGDVGRLRQGRRRGVAVLVTVVVGANWDGVVPVVTVDAAMGSGEHVGVVGISKTTGSEVESSAGDGGGPDGQSKQRSDWCSALGCWATMGDGRMDSGARMIHGPPEWRSATRGHGGKQSIFSSAP